MRVEALPSGDKKYVGYYALVRRKAGDVFDLVSPAHFSSIWMKHVKDTLPKTNAPGEPTAAEMAELHPADLQTSPQSSSRRPGRPRNV